MPLSSWFYANQAIRFVNNTAGIICKLFGVSFVNTYSLFPEVSLPKKKASIFLKMDAKKEPGYSETPLQTQSSKIN